MLGSSKWWRPPETTFWRTLVEKQIYQYSNRLLAVEKIFKLTWMIKVSVSDNNMQWFNRCCWVFRIEVITESWEHEVLGQIKNSDSFMLNPFENQWLAFRYIFIIIMIIFTLYCTMKKIFELPESMRRSASFPFMKYMFA